MTRDVAAMRGHNGKGRKTEGRQNFFRKAVQEAFMKALTRASMVAVLALALLAGVGCSKQSSETSPFDDGGDPALRAAAQQISGGIVYFDFDKYDIKPEYRDMLRQKADLMKRHPRIRVRIEGNCDARGTQEYNLALGERRARAAFDYMTMLGVNASQMELISFGKERPAVEGSGDSAWSKNRRDEFRVISGR
jgi:peptidoglycan-associated lipoprotein